MGWCSGQQQTTRGSTARRRGAQSRILKYFCFSSQQAFSLLFLLPSSSLGSLISRSSSVGRRRRRSLVGSPSPGEPSSRVACLAGTTGRRGGEGIKFDIIYQIAVLVIGGYGGMMVARLTPDQTVGCSTLEGAFIDLPDVKEIQSIVKNSGI